MKGYLFQPRYRQENRSILKGFHLNFYNYTKSNYHSELTLIFQFLRIDGIKHTHMLDLLFCIT